MILKNLILKKKSIKITKQKGKIITILSTLDGTKGTNDCLEILANCSDGVVEAVKHKELPFIGIMWHPERENLFSNFDIQLIGEHFLS